LLSLPELIQCLTAARQSRKTLQKDHHTLRQNYLAGLAEALVLKRAPYLGTDPKYNEKLTRRTAKEVKRLVRLEHKRHLYHMIGRQLGDDNINRGGLARVDVPAPIVDERNTSLEDPKQWKGPWVSITDPAEKAKYVCAVNTKQYNQAQNTPSITTVWHESGRCGICQFIRRVLHGGTRSYLASKNSQNVKTP
jgi:hypothetical protein